MSLCPSTLPCLPCLSLPFRSCKLSSSTVWNLEGWKVPFFEAPIPERTVLERGSAAAGFLWKRRLSAVPCLHLPHEAKEVKLESTVPAFRPWFYATQGRGESSSPFPPSLHTHNTWGGQIDPYTGGSLLDDCNPTSKEPLYGLFRPIPQCMYNLNFTNVTNRREGGALASPLRSCLSPFTPMIREDRQLVADEPVEFEK